MTPASDPPAGEGPLTRAQRQRQTRTALVEAARGVFARDGFAGASLDTIARDAGYSKGAVYSNFDGKAALFLAVMDHDLDRLGVDTWDPFVRVPVFDASDSPVGANLDDPGDPEVGIGFALATLEFIATAGRDPALRSALRERVATLVGAYGEVARRHRTDDDPVTEDELASMLAALDQGTALLLLGGWETADTAMLRRGLRRLLRPAPGEGPR
ncbi:MAG: TetR/AcrR family transcriptional regulator [Actinobacteria bacterium]|jgi:AcrR family transcriptional regulator|nr:TetR/AcrR family transcriptional regulator [Actinomycetota bacterium]